MAKIKVTGNGIYDANGQVEVGRTLTFKGPVPAGWVPHCEVITEENATEGKKLVVGGTDRTERYKALVGKLKPTQFTQDGKPEVDALNSLLLKDETKFDAEERDRLYEASK